MSDKLVLEGYLRIYDADMRLCDTPNPKSWFHGESVGEQVANALKVKWCEEIQRFEYGKVRITVEKIDSGTPCTDEAAPSIIERFSSVLALLKSQVEKAGLDWDEVRLSGLEG